MSLDEIQQAARDQFGRQSHRYAKGHILSQTDDIAAAANAMALPDRAEILDIACGAGHTGLFFARLGHRVTLADISADMLDRVREAARELQVEVATREHAAERLPDADGSFDLVTCRVAAHHFSSPQDFVRETARVLRRGGFFLLIDGSVPDDEPEAELWIHEVETLRDPSHRRFLTPGAWSALCEANRLHLTSSALHPMKQPDLNWYFETAATPAENRGLVHEKIRTAPAAALRVFRIAEENGTIVWWWPRLTLIARKEISGRD